MDVCSGFVLGFFFLFFCFNFKLFPWSLSSFRTHPKRDAEASVCCRTLRIFSNSGFQTDFAAWHEEADAYFVLKVTWITQEYFSRERIMSATFPVFLFLLGILHVCSGKTPTSALPSFVDIKRQESNNSTVFLEQEWKRWLGPHHSLEIEEAPFWRTTQS